MPHTRLFYHINPRVEPRASLRDPQHGQSHHGRTAPGMLGWRCTQGCIPGYGGEASIPPWYPPGYGREAGIPTMVHPEV